MAEAAAGGAADARLQGRLVGIADGGDELAGADSRGPEGIAPLHRPPAASPPATPNAWVVCQRSLMCPWKRFAHGWRLDQMDCFNSATDNVSVETQGLKSPRT